MIVSLSRHSDDSSVTFNVLAEGACHILGAELAALLITLEPAVVEIGALAGVSPEDIPLIETVLSGNPIEGPFKLEKKAARCRKCISERRSRCCRTSHQWLKFCRLCRAAALAESKAQFKIMVDIAVGGIP